MILAALNQYLKETKTKQMRNLDKITLLFHFLALDCGVVGWIYGFINLCIAKRFNGQ